MSIDALVRAILTHPEFYSVAARQGRLRSPVEWFVAAIRTTGIPVFDAHPEWYSISLGQELLNPPNVAGWKLNSYWISTSAFWAKGNVVKHFGWQNPALTHPPMPAWLPIIDLFNGPNFPAPTVTAQEVAQTAFDAAGLVSVAATTRSAVEAYLTQLRQNSADRWFMRAGLMQALLMSPDFQLA
jgi:uncharacterized protein (DUF1800 family)